MAEPLKLFSLLHDHEVEYIVIDRIAAALHGIPVVAASIAIYPLDTPENNQKLAGALNEIEPYLRLPGRTVPVTIDVPLLLRERRELGVGIGVSISTEFGIVDLIYTPAGIEQAVGDMQGEASGTDQRDR